MEIMNKLVNNSAFKWSAEDFDNILEMAHRFLDIDKEAFDKLNALTDEEKFDIVDNAIECVEESIMEAINTEIVEVIIGLSEKHNQ